MSRVFILLIGVLAICDLGSSVRAEAAATPAAVPKIAKPTDPPAVTRALSGEDEGAAQQAVQAGIQMLRDEKNGKAAATEAPNWLRLLLAQKRLDEVEQVALAVIVTQPTTLPLIEKCQEYRVRVKLIAGKPKEALALAKGLYNICSMPNTSHVIDLISECLYDANKDSDSAGIVKKYKLQQIHGASISAGNKGGGDEKPILNDVQVDAQQYKEAIAAWDLTMDGFAGLLAKGNLLLLADQPKEAKKLLEKAYSLAADRDLAAATEANARAMRAEDGTVGRANAWILSLRPQEAGQ